MSDKEKFIQFIKNAVTKSRSMTCGYVKGKKLIALSLFISGLTGSVYARDFQYWNTWAASHDLSDKAQVSMLTEVYLRDNATKSYVFDEYVTYFHKLPYGFGLAGQLYFESVKATDNTWIATRSAVAGASYSLKVPYVCSVKIEDRFFYRLNSPAQFDYHRPRIYLNRGIGPVKLTLSDEMRLDLSGARADVFYRNRVYAMASGNILKNLTLGLGYLRQSDMIGENWESFNGMQTLVAATF
jgi:hypothetical protein